MNELVQAWYNLLNGNLTYGGKMVDVWKEDLTEDAPASSNISEHYVWIHAEGGTDDSNKKSLADDCVVVVDIVTIFENNVNRLVCETIDSSIRQLLYSSASINNLTIQSGVQFGQVIRENFAYVHEGAEEAGGTTIYRKVSRYKTRVVYA